ncbi:MAG: MFS transporter [Ruminococcaceae bacterium]|nr:MFS transporter [Oscillospiraceae bacterium]
MAAEKKQTIWTRNFICIMLGNFLLQMSNFATTTLVSTYATFLGARPTLMGFLTGMFYGIALAMRPVAGPVQTRVNHKKLLIVVFALGCVVNAGYAFFHSIPMFLIFRVLHGVQYAFVGSLCMTVAADSVPDEKMASGLGMFALSGAVSQAIAPQIGIWLVAWGTSMRGEDFGYTVLFVFAVVMMVLSLIPLAAMQDTAKEQKSAVASAGKWYNNIASRHAVIPAVIMMLIMMSFSTFNGYMVPFGAELGIGDIGIFFTVFAGAMLVIRPVSGALSDKLGLRNVLLPSLALFSVSYLIIGSARGIPMILVGALFAAVGFGTGNPLTQALSVQVETRARRAVASNTLYIGMDVGFFLGPLLGGIIRDFAGNYKSVILGGSVPLALALVILLIAWKPCARRIEEVRALEAADEAA